ncbi:MAG: Ig-like domain-containing protein [bacterium]|nr:Ig-like domain-containing protein [bacterium]
MTMLNKYYQLIKFYLLKYRIWLAGGAAVGLGFVLVFLWLAPKPVKVLTVFPGNKATGVSPQFEGYAEFDSPVKMGQVKVVLVPDSKLNFKLSADQKRLDFTPQTSLVSNTSYTLRVSGGVATPTELSFKTGMLQGKDPGFGDPNVNKAVEKQAELYPLADKLPYYGEGFRIVQVKAGEYAATLFGKTDAERQIQKAKALKWLEGQGVKTTEVTFAY